MLTEAERNALITWYSRQEVLDEAKRLFEVHRFQDMEDYLHKSCLMPLGRHDALPDDMRDDEGNPLFPNNLDPRVVFDRWQDAVEVCWEVMTDKLGISHDDVHRGVAELQSRDWDSFIESVEQRKRERGQN